MTTRPLSGLFGADLRNTHHLGGGLAHGNHDGAAVRRMGNLARHRDLGADRAHRLAEQRDQLFALARPVHLFGIGSDDILPL